MNLIEIIITGVALSMDAFAVAICKGLSIKNKKKAFIIALYFGFFQIIMPIIGFAFGSLLKDAISQLDHWIAFFLLSFIGWNMIMETKNQEEQENELVDFKTMIPLAIATSIDALAIGVTFSMLKVQIISSALIIGIITTVLSYIGVLIGNHFGNQKEKKAKMVGGILLILLGVKIIIEHLEILKKISELI